MEACVYQLNICNVKPRLGWFVKMDMSGNLEQITLYMNKSGVIFAAKINERKGVGSTS